jgi:hypothetical protein
LDGKIQIYLGDDPLLPPPSNVVFKNWYFYIGEYALTQVNLLSFTEFLDMTLPVSNAIYYNRDSQVSPPFELPFTNSEETVVFWLWAKLKDTASSSLVGDFCYQFADLQDTTTSLISIKVCANTVPVDGTIEFIIAGLTPIIFVIDDLEDLVSWNFFYVGY